MWDEFNVKISKHQSFILGFFPLCYNLELTGYIPIHKL